MPTSPASPEGVRLPELEYTNADWDAAARILMIADNQERRQCVSDLICRERQLLAALTKLAALKAQKEEVIQVSRRAVSRMIDCGDPLSVDFFDHRFAEAQKEGTRNEQ